MARHIPLKHQDPRLLEAARKVTEHVPKAMLVGGFVRDAILGIQSKDADLETYGIGAEELESVLKKIFGDKVETVGRSFGIFKIPLGEGFDLDVAIPRRESKTGPGHKGFEVIGDPELDPTEAARRRDFTMNAMSADPVSGELFDPFHGQKDLEEKRLRVVDPSTFVDDPLRVYRGIQFAARFHLTIEPASNELMRLMVGRGDLDELSKERITDEWKKLLLKSPQPSAGFELMRKLGIIRKYFPELHALIDTPQEVEWHPEGDVWIHTMMVVDEAARISRRDFHTDEERLQVMLGALCHDLGKPSTTAPGLKDGVMRIRSLGHEDAGVAPTESFLARFAFGENISHAAIICAKEHLKPGMLMRQLVNKKELTEETYANAVRKLLKRIEPLPWRVYLAVSESDHLGRGLPDSRPQSYEAGDLFAKTVEKILNAAEHKPLLYGRDLEALGIKPGPLMGRLIAEVERLRDEGIIKTREQALAHITRFTFTSNPFEKK
ncbi:HD domain-containing protein [Patescibacteria group bacterium]|jgi:tRNA nucleotidyltransferase (CCA-adding enzyme)|nr:HD domain-containing protein [Patescibacteria group bacterium]